MEPAAIPTEQILKIKSSRWPASDDSSFSSRQCYQFPASHPLAALLPASVSNFYPSISRGLISPVKAQINIAAGTARIRFRSCSVKYQLSPSHSNISAQGILRKSGNKNTIPPLGYRRLDCRRSIRRAVPLPTNTEAANYIFRESDAARHLRSSRDREPRIPSNRG